MCFNLFSRQDKVQGVQHHLKLYKKSYVKGSSVSKFQLKPVSDRLYSPTLLANRETENRFKLYSVHFRSDCTEFCV